MARAISRRARLAQRLLAIALAAALVAEPALALAQDNPAAPAAPATTGAGAAGAAGSRRPHRLSAAPNSKSCSRPSRSIPTLARPDSCPPAPTRCRSSRRSAGSTRTKAAVANNDYSGIDNQNWDPAVKALARFPDVIKMMSADLDWTTDLGDAEVNQPQDVADVIQELRAKAQQNDALKTTAQQTVTTTQQPATAASEGGGALKRLTSKSSRPTLRRSTSPPTIPARSMSPIPASRLSWASGPASRLARCGTTIPGTGERARSIRRTGPAIPAGAATSTTATSISEITSTSATT